MRQPRNIIVCSDGTRNTKRTNTNVYQFFKALDGKPRNRCFYDPGVGAFVGDISGMAFGTGIEKNIRQCYEFLVDHYKPRDRIFLFGFSRGAFTVRSLANFVDLVGLVPRNHTRIRVPKKGQKGERRLKTQTVQTEQAYDLYRKNQFKVFPEKLAEATADLGLRSCPIHCIGVWDTVGAIGIPSRSNDRRAHLKHRYHRTDLSPRIRYAYQALSLDDERRVFWPNLFGQRSSPGQTIEEVWFAGMHSDVGGGYKGGPESENKQLPNLALRWMAKKMPGTLGLSADDFEEGRSLGLMHDSRTGAAGVYTCRVRRPPRGSRIHASIVDRIRGPVAPVVGDPDARYRPRSLVHRGTQSDGTPFRPTWDRPPVFGLTARYTIVDRDYRTR